MGRATGEIAAVTLLSSIAQLSYGSIFQRFLPSAGEKSRRFVVTGYVVCIMVAFVLAIAYVTLGYAHRFFSPSLSWSVLFIFTVVFFTIFALQDSVLISLRLSRWVAVENNSFGILKLALLLPFAAFAIGQGIIITWIIPLVLTVLVINWYIFIHRLPDYMRATALTQSLPTLRQMMSLSIPQFATTILNMFLTSVVTLIVFVRLGAATNADYFLVAQVAGAPALFLWSVSRLLVVESVHEPSEHRHHAFQAVWASVAILIVSMVIGIIFAHSIMQLFGPTYAQQGTTLLRLLLLALPGTAIAAIYSALAWIDGRVWYLMYRQIAVTIPFLTIVLVFIRRDGIDTVGYADVTMSGLEFLVFLPVTIRRLKSMPKKTVDNSAP